MTRINIIPPEDLLDRHLLAVYRLPRPMLATGEAICDEQWAAMERACGVRAPRQVVAD